MGNLRSVMVVLAVAAGVGRGGFVIEWPVKWERYVVDQMRYFVHGT